MRNVFVPLLLLLPSICSAKGASQEKRPAMTPQEVVRLLLRSHSLKLIEDKNPGCSKDMGSTVGDYLAFLLSTVAAAEKTDDARLRVECGPHDGKKSPLDPPKDKRSIDCSFFATVTDVKSGDGWNYGLLFRLKDDVIDPSQLACPGT